MGFDFRDSISDEQFDAFAEGFCGAPVLQSLAWAELKCSWQHICCGLFNDGKICGAAMILIRRMPLGLKLGYCPRGPLLDLKDREAVKAFSSGLFVLSKKIGLYGVIIDPLIVRELSLPDQSDYQNVFTADGEETAALLAECGFRHSGFKTGLHDYMQPRFNSLVPLRSASGERLTPDKLRKNCKKKLRYYLGEFRTRRGITFDCPPICEETLGEFTDTIKKTESRQGILLRDKSYFERMTQAFGDRARIYFSHIDLGAYIDYLQSRADEGGDKAAEHLAELERAKKLREEKGNRLTLSAMLVLLPQNKVGTRTAEYIYAGNDLSDFPAFCVAQSSLFEALCRCADEGCDYLNLGGVEADPEGNLRVFKSKLSPIVAEYYGEFVLPINKLKYAVVSRLLPKATAAYHALIKLIRRR